MDEQDRTTMEARALRWGDLAYGHLKLGAKVLEEFVTQSAVLWKHIAKRNAPRPLKARSADVIGRCHDWQTRDRRD